MEGVRWFLFCDAELAVWQFVVIQAVDGTVVVDEAQALCELWRSSVGGLADNAASPGLASHRLRRSSVALEVVRLDGHSGAGLRSGAARFPWRRKLSCAAVLFLWAWLLRRFRHNFKVEWLMEMLE